VRVRSLVLTLLLLSLFVPAAGAIYIPGQEIPDDGMMHIMSAGDNTGTASPIEMPAGITFAMSGMSGLVPGIPGSLFSQGFPARIAGSIPPAMPGVSQGPSLIPQVSLPPADLEGNIVMGDVIGHIASPPTPGYWDNLQNMDLHTNMPVVNVPAIFG